MEIIGAFYALALNQILSLLINVMFYIYYRPFKIKWIIESFITENLKKLSKFSVMAIAGPTCLIISTFIIRDHIYNEFGSDYAGSWEAMWTSAAARLLRTSAASY